MSIRILFLLFLITEGFCTCAPPISMHAAFLCHTLSKISKCVLTFSQALQPKRTIVYNFETILIFRPMFVTTTFQFSVSTVYPKNLEVFFLFDLYILLPFSELKNSKRYFVVYMVERVFSLLTCTRDGPQVRQTPC